MSDRTSSILILIGGALAILALWGLSVLVVRWDTRRRGLTEMERRAWMLVSILLPLFGFTLYMVILVVRRYLTPPVHDSISDEARMTAVKPHLNGRAYPTLDASGSSAHQTPQPAWGEMPPMRSNGGVKGGPMTLPAAPPPVRPGEAPARFALVVLEGPHLGQQFILHRLPARIGRGPDASIPLDADLNVSRKHAEVYEWNGRLRVRDLKSTHGTQVNGQRINDQPLSPGDRIYVGGTVLILREAR